MVKIRTGVFFPDQTLIISFFEVKNVILYHSLVITWARKYFVFFFKILIFSTWQNVNDNHGEWLFGLNLTNESRGFDNEPEGQANQNLEIRVAKVETRHENTSLNSDAVYYTCIYRYGICMYFLCVFAVCPYSEHFITRCNNSFRAIMFIFICII